ncbi:hypothetical protein HPB52_003155 [Rhipicephalus sanguineus]|uniref:Uncharacterized protein n=1 Tax=Rhipicephalus sanguineus TaxID=34632 RepID=A0A9D4PMP8_RHISA|nr:hypothetical protein HPB52_003155 [Rhipicephalus sanguineus]
MYRDQLRLLLEPRTTFNKWREYSRLADRTTEFLWQQVLQGLRTQVQKKPTAPSNPLHVIGDVNLPDKVQQVLKCGPKFAVEPRRTSPELLGMVRHVSKQVPEGDVDRPSLLGNMNRLRWLAQCLFYFECLIICDYLAKSL